jgi:hypothetical protein
MLLLKTSSFAYRGFGHGLDVIVVGSICKRIAKRNIGVIVGALLQECVILIALFTVCGGTEQSWIYERSYRDNDWLSVYIFTINTHRLRAVP